MRHLPLVAAWLFSSNAFSQGIVTTLAGTDWVFPARSMPALSAPLGTPSGLAVAPNGDLYISDCSNLAIFRLDSRGTLHMVVGTGVVGITPSGPAQSANLRCPNNLLFMPSGDLYFASGGIKKVSPDGQLTTIGGEGGRTGEGIPFVEESGTYITSFAVDSKGNIYYPDPSRHRIRRVTPDGIVRTYAGTGENGFSGDGGPALEARFNGPGQVAVNANDELLVGDGLNRRIRLIDRNGNVRTIAGNGGLGNTGDGIPAVDASISLIGPILPEPDGGFLFAAAEQIRRVSATGIITRIAGSGIGNTGDGGPARAAQIGRVSSISRTSSGQIWFGDEFYRRVRTISPSGIVSTIAGANGYKVSPDPSNPLTAWFDAPHYVAVSPAGLVTYTANTNLGVLFQIGADGLQRRIAGGVVATTDPNFAKTTSMFIGGVAFDANGQLLIARETQIIRIASDGRMSILAGSGRPGSSGDGGPAALATFASVQDIFATPSGEIYLTDRDTHRVRRIRADGIVEAVAGNGLAGFSGDGGPASQASLNSPRGVAVDAAGNVYIADTFNNRIRRVSADGRIETVAGDGALRFAGDNGPATRASLAHPWQIRFDNAGNLLITDSENSRLRMLRRDGTITTFAGGGSSRGDGQPPANARFNGVRGLAVDAEGRVFAADLTNNRIRAILPNPPAFTVSPSTLSIATTAEIRLDSPVTGLPFTASVPANSPWLTLSPSSGNLPAAITLTASPAGLAPGRYSTSVAINVPFANPQSRQVTVSFEVSPQSTGGRLGIGASNLTFAAQQAAAPLVTSVSLSHTAPTPSPFSITIRNAPWLAVSAAQGQTTPGAPSVIQFTATPGTLAPGTYSGSVDISSGQEKVTLPATLTINAPQGKILLSQVGLTFIAVEGGGSLTAQRIGVLNEGVGVLNVTATATVFKGGSWLRLANTQVRIDRPLEEVKFVDVSVNHSGLTAGDYYGEIRFTAPGIPPQIATVYLQVLPPGSNPGPEVIPSGLVFIGTPNSPPDSQDVVVSNPLPASISYASASVATDSVRWLSHIPDRAEVLPNEPRRIVVASQFSGLTSRVYRGSVFLHFEDGTARAVSVLTVVPQSISANKSGDREAASCSNPALAGEFLAPLNGASAAIGQPVSIQVKFTDQCGNLLNAERGSGSGVVAQFSNGDGDVPLVSIGGGVWTGTWRPLNASPVPVTIRAAAAYARGLIVQAGITQRSVRITAQGSAPIVRQGSLVHGASQRGDAPIAPGTLVSIYGANLAAVQSTAPGTPLPTQLDGAEVLLAGQPLPLLFASPGQINAQVPFDLPPNTTHQIVVRRNGAVSVPETFAVAGAQPGVFTVNQSGAGQAVILGPDQRNIADTANPARRGQAIVIYCTGLGSVTQPISPGQAAPSSPLAVTRSPVETTVGGRAAQVVFSGLTPGFSGLYQVNAILAADTPTGDSVPVVITANGRASDPVTIAVR
jgi:uncharacterized protein (TIGR03437 family)